jgi:ribonucleoside-diphosphate reductase alpha subunit
MSRQPLAAATDTKVNNVNDQDMRVVKRDGTFQNIAFDKILNRVKNVGAQAGITSINYTTLAIKVIDQLYDGIHTTKIDELTAEQCATMAATHPDYLTLASHVIMSNHHKTTSDRYSDVVDRLHQFRDTTNRNVPLVSNTLHRFVRAHAEELNAMIDYSRDYTIDYFGFKTLERSYLMRDADSAVAERPQHMWMRVSIGIHVDDTTGDTTTIGHDARAEILPRIRNTYDLMSLKYFTHATPTLFNAGTPRSQLSSCYLVGMERDSIEGIFDTLKECAIISKYAGGVGLHVHNIRAAGSLIRGTAGTSNGLVPMLRVFNNTARYIDQGGKRNGSFAIYLEPWHADVEAFLELKKYHGDEEMKARDLFYAMWIPDLFMQRVMQNAEWSLFCPDECPGLSDAFGEGFESLYTEYEAAGKQRKTVSARDIWLKILDSQMETGTPYLLYKDAANRKSNQQNLGTIRSSNLCAEIIEYSDSGETAVCNLASIALNRFVNPVSRTFDYAELHRVVETVTRNLNRVIDINFYPTERTRISNLKHRPIGIGVQGLADVFMMMDVAFYSDTALELNRLIFETIYHSAVETSAQIALEIYNRTGTTGAYSSFEGSPASKGLLQFDLWGIKPASNRYDWDDLKSRICKHGMRNSLLVALMPTASTSQILGNNECFEPITSNIYTRRTLAGEFIVVNRYLMADLIRLGAWNERTKQHIIKNKGSVQQLEGPGIDDHLKNKYRTVWEIPMKHLIDMSVDRGAYVCQSQSLNLWVEDPNYNVLTSMHFYAWKRGLKTGIYYLRRKAKHQAQQFTVDVVDHATSAGASMSSSNHNHNVSPLANADPDAEAAGSGYEECEFCSS